MTFATCAIKGGNSLIVINSPLKVIRGILVICCGGFMLIGGVSGLTGHGLSLPFFARLGGSQISLMGSVYIAVVGLVFVLLGSAELLDRPPNALYRKEIKAILKSMVDGSAHADEREAAKTLLETVNKHSTSQEIKNPQIPPS